MSTSSPAPCGAWSRAAPRSTPRSSPGCWRPRWTTGRCPRSARVSARCSRWSPRAARTRPSASDSSSASAASRSTSPRSSRSWAWRRTRTTTGESSPFWSTSGSTVPEPPAAAEPPGTGAHSGTPRHLRTVYPLEPPPGTFMGSPTQELPSMTSALIPNSTPAPIAPPAVVSARDVVRRYGTGDTAVDALRGVSVDIAQGRLTAVMGPSGSGKSTLMHILAGLDKPTSGEVTVAGVEIAGLDDTALTKLRRDHIGFIFQFFNLLPMLTAAENIALPLKLAGGKPDSAWLAELIETVGLSDRLGHRPSELSGGQQQRVAVARALVSRPSVMFADEPTGNLDSTTSGEILALLRESVDTLGQTTVMVTHDAHAAAIADRVLFLADGDIVRDLGPSSAHEILETLEQVTER